VLCIPLLRGRFGGLSTALVSCSGVGRTWDGYSFGRVLGELPDWFCCIPDLDLADRMPLGTTWPLLLFRFRTRRVGWLRELACGCLDMVES